METKYLTVSILMGKRPVFILSGLGALTAVLMLIFKDSIIGLVAGVQVAINDSFINWCYMSDSKGRRIKRPVWISATSIREMNEEPNK